MKRQRSSGPADSEDEGVLVIVVGSGDPAGDLPDPGPDGFAVRELYAGSVQAVELDDGTQLLDGVASAVRGTPPPNTEGCVLVYPGGDPDECLAQLVLEPGQFGAEGKPS